MYTLCTLLVLFLILDLPAPAEHISAWTDLYVYHKPLFRMRTCLPLHLSSL